MIKYLVLPRRIPSKNDGDFHFISAMKLIELYRVPRSECLIIQPGERLPPPGFTEEFLYGLIKLQPRYDGSNYDSFL